MPNAERENLPSELQELYDRVEAAAKSNEAFAYILEERFGRQRKQRFTSRSGRGNRRAKGVLDPFVVIQGGEHELRTRLSELDIEQLKDIVAEHGMDTSKLAMKWRTSERLIDLIVSTVELRRSKGSVFRL